MVGVECLRWLYGNPTLMATAFRTYTPDGVLQLDSNSPGLGVYDHGRFNAFGSTTRFGRILVPLRGPGTPLFLFRPDPDAAVGAVVIDPTGYGEGTQVLVASMADLDWAMVSPTGPHASTGVTQPVFRVYTPDGRLSFSTQFRYPRIRQIFSMPAPSMDSEGGGFPTTTFPLSGWSSMPWVLTSSLGYSRSATDGTGSGSYPPYVFSARINASLSEFRVEARDSALFYEPGSGSQSLNPYANRPMWFALCEIPGL